MPVSDPVFTPHHRHSEYWSEDDVPDIMHYVCDCNEDIALCGADVSGEHWDESPDPEVCVVCEDLDNFLCPRCGL